MEISTSRFGKVQVNNEDLIEFPEGILGFGLLRQFILLDDPADEIFAWLQSCEEGAIAFPILEPELFESNYKIKLSRHDQEALRIFQQEKPRVFVIVTIPNNVIDMTVNMKAPVVINVLKRVGRQCVLQDNDLNIQEPIFSRLQQRMVQFPQAPLKPQQDPKISENWVRVSANKEAQP